MTKSELEKRISDSHYASQPEFERTNKKFMRGMLPTSQQLRILDVGCGTGLNTSHFVRAGHEVVGLDLSSVAIEKYRSQGFEGFVCDIEAGAAPFPEGSFDLVYASEIIEHCANTSAFLGELYRLVRRGGTLLVSTPNSAFWAYRLLGMLGQAPSEYQHPGHVRFFSKRHLVKAVEQAGFQVDKVAARHMYFVMGRRLGDPISPLLERVGFLKEPRFATGDHFWQLSRFSGHASGFWADALIVEAKKA